MTRAPASGERRPTLTDEDAELLVDSLLSIGSRFGIAKARGLLRGNPHAFMLEAAESPELAALVRAWQNAGVDVAAAVERWINHELEGTGERKALDP